jgi:hypothetical protein
VEKILVRDYGTEYANKAYTTSHSTHVEVSCLEKNESFLFLFTHTVNLLGEVSTRQEVSGSVVT